MSEQTTTNPFLRWQQAWMQEGFSQTRRMLNLPSVWQKSQRIKKGATPSEVVYEEDQLKLLHYPSPDARRHRTPLLFVYALVNRPYILDLKPGRSVVARFVNSCFDTYWLDWAGP